MNTALFSCMTCKSRERSALSDIPLDVLDELNKTRVTNIYKKGQTIFYEGNRPYGVYCMTSGKVKLVKHAPDGKNFIVKIAKQGDLLGYRAFFTNELYSSTAEVLEDSMVCFIDKDKFFDLIRKYPPFSLKLLAMMGHDIKCAEENSRDMAYKSSQERIVETILSLNDVYGQKDENSIKVDIQLSRDDLASLIGTTTETTVRLLTWLKEKKLITMKSKYIYINDLDGLKSLVPDY
ncbi:MAG: Crp/Fnr family transcriptional regulator [Candidatus Sericytochromatia bacterium]